MKSEFEGRCRQALISDIEVVANIHLEAFQGFFLSNLGYNFLCVMYRAFLIYPDSIFVVHESEDGNISGFAVGTLSGARKDWSIALRSMPRFFWAALPAIFRYPSKIVPRLFSRFFESGSSLDVPDDAAMLRSIGIMTSERGRGAADRLIGAFERIASQRGAAHIYLTTDQDDNERAQNFYKRHGYRVAACYQQDRLRSMCLMSKRLMRVVHE